jgi:cytochrome c oxidase cbb3-type subunit 3
MSSPFGEPGIAFVAAALTLLAAGCSREARHFNDPSGANARSGIALTELQAGTQTAPPTNAGPYDDNAYAISEGKRLFRWYNCSGCHAHGGGDSGPALMDDKWIYGSSPSNIFATVIEGRPNGMPAFRDHLTDAQVWQLVAYVQALGGRLPRDVLPARDDHMFTKPGEQSLPKQRATQSTLPPGSTQ